MRSTPLICPKCFANCGEIKEPKTVKTFSCKKHGRFTSTVRWFPPGYAPGTQHFVATKRGGK